MKQFWAADLKIKCSRTLAILLYLLMLFKR